MANVKIVKGHAKQNAGENICFYHLRDAKSGKFLTNKSGKRWLEFRSRSAAERFIQRMKENEK